MQDYLYSVIGIIAIAVMIIINAGTVLAEKKSEQPFKAYKSYRALVIAVFAYCITDALWGIFAGLNWIPALFVDTTVYYTAMGAIVLCWTLYIIEYLELKGIWAGFFKYTGVVFFVLENIFLVVNFFYPCFFYFDENDAYQACIVRYVALYFQVAMFLIAVLITGYYAIKPSTVDRKRSVAIFLFSLVMLAADYFQILYPLLPIYAMGCLVGCCILHVYVIEDEREQFGVLLAAEKEKAERASAAKTNFLFNMSHDIRTPMNAILGFTRIAKNHIDDREKVEDSLDKIETSGGQLLNLINDILEMSRIEAGKLEIEEAPGDIIDCIDGITPMLESSAVAKSILYSTSLKNIQNRRVWVDSSHTSRVIVNLISNAIKYTPDGGKVNVTAEQCGPAVDGKAVYKISVADTGIGMSEEFLTHIFEEFSRERTSTVSKQQGTGLGLAIAKHIVDSMGGSIDVASEVGKGSTFTLTLPLRVAVEEETEEVVSAAGENPNMADASVGSSLEGKTVLLVEDNALNREIALDILGENGLDVTTAEDGLMAVNIIREKARECQRVQDCFDFVLMDVQMPVMDGYTATGEIRKMEEGTDSHIVIIAMTANAFAEDRAQSAQCGMDAHLAKPVDFPQLLKTLAELARA